MIACKCSERFVSVLLIVTVDSSLNVRVHASGNRYFLARTDTRTRTCVRAHTQSPGGMVAGMTVLTGPGAVIHHSQSRVQWNESWGTGQSAESRTTSSWKRSVTS